MGYFVDKSLWHPERLFNPHLKMEHKKLVGQAYHIPYHFLFPHKWEAIIVIYYSGKHALFNSYKYVEHANSLSEN